MDEAHGFRSDDSNRYDELQKICKSPCENPGLLRDDRKKVMLLSATPLNNCPDDLLHQLLLFQDSRSCTIDGIPNLKDFFAPYIAKYKKLMRDREKCDVTEEVDKIYAELREKVIDKVTVRRTRTNIVNDKDYKADLDRQHIAFPHIAAPESLEYRMSAETSRRFYETLEALSDEKNDPHLHFARYRAVEFLKSPYKEKYHNAEQIGRTLAGIYRVHMVKRLESSFHAFKISLKTLLRITNDMLRMFSEDKVLIIPDMDVKSFMAKGWELDVIIQKALEKGKIESDISYPADCFEPEFKEMLEADRALLEYLNADWDKEFSDPKFDEFRRGMESFFFAPERNVSGKLVLFSESVDTLEYLYNRIRTELHRDDVLMVTAKNRKEKENTIRENFDANHSVKSDRYNIIITSDVLAEGVNLHRSNVIINYDSPWNATRLMQRIGRVNRIGSVANMIYNYMFYPSKEGDAQIRLYKNALVKLQGFHSAFGEDAQIYSREEIVKQFQLFDSTVRDSIDEKIKLLREVRELFSSDRKLYNKIKALPMKSRVMRNTGKHSGRTVIFIQSEVKTEFFLANADSEPKPIDFLEAVKYLRAKPEEQPVPFTNEPLHYKQVNRAVEAYRADYEKAADSSSINKKSLDRVSREANNFLRGIKRNKEIDDDLKKKCDTLISIIKEGSYARLPREVRTLSHEYKDDRQKIKADERRIADFIDNLIDEYQPTVTEDTTAKTDPRIIISESFV